MSIFPQLDLTVRRGLDHSVVPQTLVHHTHMTLVISCMNVCCMRSCVFSMKPNLGKLFNSLFWVILISAKRPRLCFYDLNLQLRNTPLLLNFFFFFFKSQLNDGPLCHLYWFILSQYRLFALFSKSWKRRSVPLSHLSVNFIYLGMKTGSEQPVCVHLKLLIKHALPPIKPHHIFKLCFFMYNIKYWARNLWPLLWAQQQPSQEPWKYFTAQ